jgi:hypothetical protein
MPTTPPQIDPEQTRTEKDVSSAAASQPEAPVSVVPHEGNSAAIAAPTRFRTNRYGDMEEHELLRLLDTIEDERARGRFRESVYISTFVCIALAWVALYGPRYLWHAPELISPVDMMKHQEQIALNNPVLPRHVAPAPKLDRGTIAKIKAMTPKAAPAPPAPNLPVPSAPSPVPRSSAPPVNTPLPEAPQRPNFNTPATASDAMQQAIHSSTHSGGGGNVTIGNGGGGGRGPGLGAGPEILSDTQGVDFQPYLARIMRLIYEQWIPLIPEEARPPLNKQGWTQVRFSIAPDGNLVVNGMHLDASSHDEALDRAAWGSIVGVGQFPPLPRQFHGPMLELRIHYLVNKQTE